MQTRSRFLDDIDPTLDDVEYPSGDGEPMAENTEQYDYITAIKGNLDIQFRAHDTVFVAGDHLIYPVRGDNATRRAPDVYVAFGRPKGPRGSYKVWLEGNIFPQVVFEIWSPSNTARVLKEKRLFYQRFGAEEYYLIYPDTGETEVWIRQGINLVEVEEVATFVSPRLGIRFDPQPGVNCVIGSDGKRFVGFEELGSALEEAESKAEQEKERAEEMVELANEQRKRAEREKKRAESEKQLAEAEKQRADIEKKKAEALAAKLRSLGVDPDAG